MTIAFFTKKNLKTLITTSALSMTVACTTNVNEQDIKTAAENSFLISTSQSLNLKSIPQASPNFSKEGLAALDARIRQFVVDQDAAGIEAVLVKDGKIVQYVKEGLQNTETQTPISDDTIYRIYSMTKPITGVAMMMLYEQGAFKLDDPITKFIPEFANLKVFSELDADGKRTIIDADREPTMQDLMSHMAGFSYGFLDTDPLTAIYRENQVLSAPDLDSFIERLAKSPLQHQPGAKWNYSVATDVQGAIIERITGKSFGEFLSKNLFIPLGMKDTGFTLPDSKRDRLSDGFIVNPETKKVSKLTTEQIEGMGPNYRANSGPFESGGYGLVSTLKDYMLFCQMLANGGELDGKRYLKEETVLLMRQNVLPEGHTLVTPGIGEDDGGVGLSFGLNFGLVSDAKLSPTPYGQDTYFWGGLAGTWFWIDPEHDLYYIGMVQVYPGGAPVTDFRRISADLVYAALKK